MSSTFRAWVIADNKAGTLGQPLGLTHALGVVPTVFPVRPKGIWRFLPPSLWFSPFRGIDQGEAIQDRSFPDLVIGAGRSAAAPVMYIKKASPATIAVFIQNPYMRSTYFDLVVVPQHDKLSGGNVITTVGALHRLTEQSLLEAKQQWHSIFLGKVALLLGGSSRHYLFTKEAIDKGIRTMLTTNKPIVVLPSRRTPEHIVSWLKSAYPQVHVWDIQGEVNPYIGLIACADSIVVTGDSVSMLSEAAFTGNTVYILPLPRAGNTKLDTFHKNLCEGGYALPLQKWGQGRTHKLDERLHIAHNILSLMSQNA